MRRTRAAILLLRMNREQSGSFVGANRLDTCLRSPVSEPNDEHGEMSMRWRALLALAAFRGYPTDGVGCGSTSRRALDPSSEPSPPCSSVDALSLWQPGSAVPCPAESSLDLALAAGEHRFLVDEGKAVSYRHALPGTRGRGETIAQPRFQVLRGGPLAVPVSRDQERCSEDPSPG